jgi:hypothetical protein
MKPTALELLETVVSTDTAQAIIDHRLLMKEKMSPLAAKGFVRQLLMIPETMRDECVEHWAMKGWRGFYAQSLMDAVHGVRRADQPKGIIGAVVRAVQNENSRWSDGYRSAGGGDDRPHVEHIPAIAKH